MRRRALPTVVALLSLAPICSSGAATARVGSGITGVVRVAARSNVAPAFEIRATDGRLVATVRPRNGRFRVGLVPGLYRLRPAASQRGWSLAPARVTVRPHAFTFVVVRFYSRIS
jgi:hypothetical protein